MSEREKIHIDYLCNEPFWKFTKSGNNTYCKLCKESIHDFTSIDNKSVYQRIKGNGGQICGTFYKDQFIIDEHTKSSQPFLKALFIGAISTLITVLKVDAQEIKKDSTKTEQYDTKPSSTQQSNKSDSLNSSTLIASNECIDSEPPDFVESRKKATKLFQVGKTICYVSKRFPFIHFRRIHRGKVRFRTPIN